MACGKALDDSGRRPRTPAVVASRPAGVSLLDPVGAPRSTSSTLAGLRDNPHPLARVVQEQPRLIPAARPDRHRHPPPRRPALMAWSSSTRARRLPNDWKRRRLAVLERDGWRCTRLVDGKRCTARATEVDHVHRGDDHRLENLAALCTDCHRVKTQAEAAAGRHRHRMHRELDAHPGLVNGGGGPPTPAP